MTTTGEAGPSTAAHRMRITSAGSISNYVKFAKTFLLDNPDKTLVLHTIPSDPDASRKSPGPTKSTTTLHSCTTTVPKLISVVEQIKRELIYPPKANQEGDTKRKGKSVQQQRHLRGIWQYTESGLLPAPPREEEDLDPLVRVLEGNTRPKMTHRPYLQITLATRPLNLDQAQNVTCQYIMTKGRNRPSAGSDGEIEGHPRRLGQAGKETATGTEYPAGPKAMTQSGEEVHIGRGHPHATKRKSSASQEIQSREKKRSKKVEEVKDLGRRS